MPVYKGSSLAKRIVGYIASLLIVASGSTYFAVQKLTPDGATAGQTIVEFRTSSGAVGSNTGATVAWIDEVGNASFSGSLTVQGVQLGTGGSLSQSELDNRYVLEQGDTMTGSLTVHGTMSGTTFSGKTLEVQQVNPTYLPFQITLSGTALAVSSGTVAFTVPPALNGFNICDAVYQTDNAGITGTNDLQLYNITDGTHVYSTPFSIDSLENTSETAATPGVINTSNDDVNTDEVLLFGVAEIHSGTAAQGLKGYLKFCLP